ncbi:MAG: hypothetical protein ACREQM_07510 [Candidatus Dormibacteraceae bacterium]
MRPRALTLLIAMALVCAVLVTACGGPVGPTPGSVALRRSDVPAGWTRCGWSGSLGGYLHAERKDDARSASSVAESWTALQKVGATSAQVTGYVAARADCRSALGGTAGPSALTWTIAYGSARQAHRGYERGVLGFPTPDPGRLQAGLEIGSSTGLSADSWILTQTTPAPALYVGWWREGALTTLLLVLGLPATSANPIALRVDARMSG